MARAGSIAGKGTGWHGQSLRHSRAKSTGRAGGNYENNHLTIEQTFVPSGRGNNPDAGNLDLKYKIKEWGYIFSTQKEAEKYASEHIEKNGIILSKKDLTYSQLKKSGIKLNPNSDSDGDGVKNKDDCRPLNKNAQDDGIPTPTTEAEAQPEKKEGFFEKLRRKADERESQKTLREAQEIKKLKDERIKIEGRIKIDKIYKEEKLKLAKAKEERNKEKQEASQAKIDAIKKIFTSFKTKPTYHTYKKTHKKHTATHKHATHKKAKPKKEKWIWE